jgi:polyphosphate kinase
MTSTTVVAAAPSVVASTSTTTTSGAESDAPVKRDATRFLNREISWLAFNSRVLEEASNTRHPLLERLRFLSISASNLAEFYSVRLAGILLMSRDGVKSLSTDGLTLAQQLDTVARKSRQIMAEQQRVFVQLRAELTDNRIVLCCVKDLTLVQRDFLDRWFMEQLFAVLTPLAIDPAHPFPFIQNMTLVLVLKLHRVRDGHMISALIPLPSQVSRC